MPGCLPMTEAQYAAALAAVAGPWPQQQRALLAVGCATGFRISELLSLTRGDVIGVDGRVRPAVHVARRRMKAKKEGRRAHLDAVARGELRRWLRQAEDLGFVHRDDPVWLNARQAPMSRFVAYRRIRRALEKAGLADGRPLGTHTMRKTYAKTVQDALAEAGDPNPFLALVKLMGHASPSNTMSYVQWEQANYDGLLERIGARRVAGLRKSAQNGEM